MRSEVAISGEAAQARTELGLDENSPVGDLPFLIKDVGYKYIEERFEDGFAGFCQYMGGSDFLIGYNLRIDYGEQFKRFTLAHELGHVWMPDHQKKLLGNQKMHRSLFNEQYDRDTEKEADCFSAHFLAPSKSCYEILANRDSSPATIAAIADHFNISLHAAALRFVDLTDITCSLVFCNKNGRTKFERRSQTMKALKHGFIYNSPIPQNTLAAEFVQGTMTTDTCSASLSLWYPGIGKEMPGTESVIDFGYDGRFAVILTPNEPRIDEYLESEDI